MNTKPPFHKRISQTLLSARCPSPPPRRLRHDSLTTSRITLAPPRHEGIQNDLSVPFESRFAPSTHRLTSAYMAGLRLNPQRNATTGA